MRPLRFRAWDKLSKSMRYGTMLQIAVAFDNPDFEVMQCTGLSDCHGKPIWEGDVVRCKDFEDMPGVAVVTYTEHNAAFMVVNEDKEAALWLYEAQHGIEVLGNIHEHPHLRPSEASQ